MSGDRYEVASSSVYGREHHETDFDDRRQQQQQQQRGPRRAAPSGRIPQIGTELVILTDKIILPVKQFPTYNFVGKLLGPKGSNLKGMQTFAKVKMSIKGRGSTKDPAQEEQLIESGDAQHQHLAEPLHVVVSARAPKIEAHRRLALACRELQKFMGPVNEEMALANPQISLGDVLNPRGGEQILVPAAAAAPGPQICFGVPPPGAIILNEHPQFAQALPPPPQQQHGSEERKPRRDSYSSYRASPEDGRSEKRGPASSTTSSYPMKRFKQEPSTYHSYAR